MLSFLASLDLGPLERLLHTDRVHGPVVFVPSAASQLADRADVVGAVRDQLLPLDRPIVDLDLEEANGDEVRRAVGGAGIVVVGAGDPFHLLDTVRASGFAPATRGAVGRGVPYVGVSAGAAVAGPSLEPLLAVSPFRPREGTRLDGLGLVDQVVLAHRDREDRAHLMRRLVRSHEGDLDVRPLADDEVLVCDSGVVSLWSDSTSCFVRDAKDRDVRGIAETFVDAAHAAWSAFLDRLPVIHEAEADWGERLRRRPLPGNLLVADRDGRVVGFAWVQPATDDDLPCGFGELSTFSTRPEVWGQGVGRVLMGQALDALARSGLERAVLWTEERNERPLGVYERLGWRPDGAVRERDYLGAPLRELRLAIEL